MLTKALHSLVAILFILSMSGVVLAQRDVALATDKAALKKLSSELKKRAEAAQKQAKNAARRNGWPVRQELPDGTVIEIQRISPNGMPVFYITENADAADTVSTDEVHPGGAAGLNLNGAGMTLGLWDEAAVLGTHPEFTGRVTQIDSPAADSLHATHVAGTLIAAGVNPAARGMAYAASLDAYDWNNDASEMAAAAANGQMVSNHSYGNATGWLLIDPLVNPPVWWWLGGPLNSDVEDPNFGYYNADAQSWDQIAFDAPYYLIVKSAGNDRDDFGPAPGASYSVVDVDGNFLFTSNEPRNSDCSPAGYDCTPTISTAKNILTVGAVDDIPGGYPGPNAVTMSSFSGWGPTDDGRIKPDLVANGIALFSPITLPFPFDYFPLDGTSMAAPNVAGSLLLLQEHYQDTHSGFSMRSATLKALAIHTADEAGAADGPDYEYGWGLLNTESAARVITEDGGKHRIIEDILTATPGSTNITQINVNSPDAVITATLVWTDPPGTPPSPALNSPDKMLVNDLDLRIHDASSTYLPWVLDPASPADPATVADNNTDNVEQVVISSGGPGAYFVEVSHKGTLLSGIDQNYSLIISAVSRQAKTIINIEDADFGSGLPSGWSTSSTRGAQWAIGDPAVDNANQTGGTGKYAWVNNNFRNTDTELLMPVFDMSTYTSVNLKFKSHFVFELLETANVDVSTDGGTAWTNVWQLFGFAPGPSTYFVDLTGAAAGESTVLIRFRYYTGGDPQGDLWQIDDVELAGSTSVATGDTCGNSYNLPAKQWRFISLPCNPGASNSILDLFGDDLPPADYAANWLLWDKDAASNQYNAIVDINTAIVQGKGYYLYSVDSGLLDMTGTATPQMSSANCQSPDQNCFEIPLVKPADPASTYFNALGHPFPYPVDWADFRIVAVGDLDSPMTPSQALAKNYLSKVAYKYTGSAFAPYDDVTPGYDEGAFGAWDGFWVKTLGGSLSTGDLTLLIPNTRSPGVITTDSAEAISIENTAVTAKTNEKTKIPPGLAKRDTHRKSHRDKQKKGEEWYVRLIIEAPAEQLKDDGNVLGQLYDSEFDFDEHDLLEPSPASPYLTILFPHDAWVGNTADYTSDFHPVTAKKFLDQWNFDVLSDDPAREVTLKWTGPARILGMSWLIDQESGEVIEPDSRDSYTFIMNGRQRHFTWEYEMRPGNSGGKQ